MIRFAEGRPFLEDEEVISAMAKALRGVHVLKDPQGRVAAYEKAGIASERIREFDGAALQVETVRRRAMLDGRLIDDVDQDVAGDAWMQPDGISDAELASL